MILHLRSCCVINGQRCDARVQLATPTCVLLIKVAGLLLLPSALDAFLR
jgi:hypothetical protein